MVGPEHAADSLLDARNVTVRFRVYGGRLHVLDGVNFRVGAGERVGLVGETGCGKTTLMKTIMRILAPNADPPEGQVWFKGRDLIALRPAETDRVRRESMSMIFQDPTAALNPVFPIASQMYDAIRAALGREATSSRVRELAMQSLRDVSLPDPERILRSYPFQLSGGMRQRVCIAMAVAVPRDIIIADEPGTSLDVTIQEQILRLLQEIVERKGTSIILITHSLGVVREMSDRAYVMYAGTMVESAPAGRLIDNPLHPYTKGLVASVPRLTGGGVAVGIKGRIPDYLNPPGGCRFYPRCDEALPECSRVKPAPVEVESGHQVACLRYGEGGKNGY